MSKFKEIPRMYQADEVDSEIAILTQSKEFWRKKAEENLTKHNNYLKKVCSKCGHELSEYAIEKDICNRCSVGMPTK